MKVGGRGPIVGLQGLQGRYVAAARGGNVWVMDTGIMEKKIMEKVRLRGT